VMRGAAELRLLGPFHPREAEAAFSVEKNWQGRGIGTALMRETLGAAKSKGLERIHMACLPSNGRMLKLMRNFGAELRFDSGNFDGKIQTRCPEHPYLDDSTKSQTFVTAALGVNFARRRGHKITAQ
jgi:GNAT superfamily N-acetyltransferase